MAGKAIQAAKAAEAALAAKEAMVEQLERETKEAETVVQEESSSLQRNQENANIAIQAARQAQEQVRTLTQAIQIANLNLGNARTTAEGAQREFEEKQDLLEASKRRVEDLIKRFDSAKIELANTKRAADKATEAARQAKVNTDRNRRRKNFYQD